MPAYVIADVRDVRDQDALVEYRRGNTKSVARHGGRFVVRGGEMELFEGEWDTRRIVVIGFRTWPPRASGTGPRTARAAEDAAPVSVGHEHHPRRRGLTPPCGSRCCASGWRHPPAPSPPSSSPPGAAGSGSRSRPPGSSRPASPAPSSCRGRRSAGSRSPRCRADGRTPPCSASPPTGRAPRSGRAASGWGASTGAPRPTRSPSRPAPSRPQGRTSCGRSSAIRATPAAGAR